jgi:hypothetical protein
MVRIQTNKDPDKLRVKKHVSTVKFNPKLVKNINISEQKKSITKNSVSKKIAKDIYVSDDELNNNNIESIIIILNQ